MGLLPRTVAQNGTLKLASLGLALFLWAVVRVEPADRQELTDVPVRVQVGDLDWSLSGSPEPASVRVRFAGPVREVLRLDREGTAVRVPLEQVTSADTVVQLRRDWVVLGGASGLIVEDVQPPTVRLQLVRNVTESRPVALRTNGQLPEGLALAAPITILPAAVQIRGGSDRVDAIDSIATAAVELNRIEAAPVSLFEVELIAPAGISLDPTRVRLEVQLDSLDEQFVPSLQVEPVGADAELFTVEPEVLVVGLSGARSVLSAADISRLRLEVDVSALGDLETDEARRLPVQVLGVPELVRAEPVVSQVTVRRRDTP